MGLPIQRLIDFLGRDDVHSDEQLAEGRKVRPGGSGATDRRRGKVPIDCLLDSIHQLAELSLGGGIRTFQCAQKSTEHVARLQDQIDVARVQRDRLRACFVEQELRVVGQFDDRLKMHEPRDTLDCVERAENGVDQLDVLEILLQRQQRFLCAGDVLASFAQEILQVGVRRQIVRELDRLVASGILRNGFLERRIIVNRLGVSRCVDRGGRRLGTLAERRRVGLNAVGGGVPAVRDHLGPGALQLGKQIVVLRRIGAWIARQQRDKYLQPIEQVQDLIDRKASAGLQTPINRRFRFVAQLLCGR